MPPLRTRGRGRKDYSQIVPHIGTIAKLQGTVKVIVVAGSVEVSITTGTLNYLRRQGTLGYAGRLGTLQYQPRLGTLTTVDRIGTLTYAKRLGTVGYAGRLGTISHVGTLGARDFSGIGAGWGVGTHVARGSWYTGSWVDVARFRNKTLAIHPLSLSGTVHIMASILGQATERGSYYTSRIGKGTYTTKSFTESLKEVRAEFEASGSSVTGKGTLLAEWGLQV